MLLEQKSMNELQQASSKLLSLLDGVSGDIATTDVQQKIQSLEDEWKELPQVDIPVKHHYAGGIYIREITIPADTALTGRIYLDDHFDIMVSGEIVVSSIDGIKHLSGFNLFPGNQGKKRAGYTITDTRWFTICCSPDTEIETITAASFDEYHKRLTQRELIDESVIKEAFSLQKSYKLVDYPSFKNGYLAACGKQLKSDADYEDFLKVLTEYGFTEAVVKAQSENESDLDLTGCYPNVDVKGSDIQGKGLVAYVDIEQGSIIAPARVDGMRTIAGRYTNHSILTNATMVWNGDNIDLVATENISGGVEITIDYRDSLNLQLEKVG